LALMCDSHVYPARWAHRTTQVVLSAFIASKGGGCFEAGLFQG
jgi:hypothetical protein